jgi:hypothetical protein
LRNGRYFEVGIEGVKGQNQQGSGYGYERATPGIFERVGRFCYFVMGVDTGIYTCGMMTWD